MTRKSTDAERERTCPGCGGTFLADKPSQKRKFCGHVCKGLFYGNAAMIAPGPRARANDARRNTGKPGNYVKREGRHEHRVVAEKMLGRKLLPDEVVRHRDRVKSNNADTNLQVMTRPDFARLIFAEARQHRTERQCG